MKSKIVWLVILLAVFACSNKKEEPLPEIKEGNGTVWLSGGLYFCAEQIRMDNGDTLIAVNTTKVLAFKSGDKVNVIYQETGLNESSCSGGSDCEIIEIDKIE